MKLKNIIGSKEARYKRIYTVWFYLHDILEVAKLIYSDRKQISGFLGLEDSVDFLKRGMKECFRVMGMPHLDFSSGYVDVYIYQNALNCTLKNG